MSVKDKPSEMVNNGQIIGHQQLSINVWPEINRNILKINEDYWCLMVCYLTWHTSVNIDMFTQREKHLCCVHLVLGKSCIHQFTTREHDFTTQWTFMTIHRHSSIWFYWMFYDHFSARSLLAKLGRWGNDDEDEVGLKEKPEDTRYRKKITSK